MFVDLRGYRPKAKINLDPEGTKFSRELRAKVLLAQDKTEYSVHEMREIGRGLGKLTGRNTVGLRRVLENSVYKP
jgi:hypothetical protein